MRNVLKVLVLVVCLPLAAAASDKDDKDKDKNPPPPASQPVTVQNQPTVIVGNTPTVQLAPGAQIQVTPAAQTPFQAGLHIHIDAGGTVGFETFDVPAGKRAVIEYASALGGAGGSAQLSLFATTAATFGTGTAYMSLPLQNGPFGLSGSQLMKAYGDPGTQIGCVMYVTSGPADLNCVINGHFVDVQ